MPRTAVILLLFLAQPSHGFPAPKPTNRQLIVGWWKLDIDSPGTVRRFGEDGYFTYSRAGEKSSTMLYSLDEDLMETLTVDGRPYDEYEIIRLDEKELVMIRLQTGQIFSHRRMQFKP